WGVNSIELQNDAGGGRRDQVGGKVDGAAEEKPSLRKIFDDGGEIDAQASFQVRRRRQPQGATIRPVRRKGKIAFAQVLAAQVVQVRQVRGEFEGLIGQANL